MIQKCPNCGIWVQTDSENSGGTGGAMAGAAAGAAAGSFIPGLGTLIGGIAGGVAGAFLGESKKWEFVCPDCGHEWTVEDEIDDQTDEFEEEQELKSSITELVDSSSSLINSSSEEKTNHIKALQSYISDSSIDDISNSKSYKGILYDALAYSQLVLQKDSNAALASVKQSLSLFPEDPTSLSIRGMIFGVSEKPLDDYATMKSLVHYSDIDADNSYTHFTISQFSERFAQLSTSYINGFLDIPVNNRRFLVVDDKFRCLPDSFVVLPYDMLPHGIMFPSGHPRVQELYVVHPYKPNEYIPYNDYQLSLFRDELREFSWIMECLGAKSISFHETQSEESNATREQSAKTGGKADYAGQYSAEGAYDSGAVSTEYRKLTSELMEAKEYCITRDTLPYIPQDVVWYQHRPDWHRNCESRKAGRLSKASFKLSTSSITATSNQERKKIEADLKILLFKANGCHEQEENIQLRSEENHTWSVDVEFYPLDDYNIKKKEVLIEQPSTLVAQQSNVLQEKKKPNYLTISLVAVIIVLIGVILAIVLC